MARVPSFGHRCPVLLGDQPPCSLSTPRYGCGGWVPRAGHVTSSLCCGARVRFRLAAGHLGRARRRPVQWVLSAWTLHYPMCHGSNSPSLSPPTEANHWPRRVSVSLTAAAPPPAVCRLPAPAGTAPKGKGSHEVSQHGS